jgi:hypothetical protein
MSNAVPLFNVAVVRAPLYSQFSPEARWELLNP